LSWVGAVWKIWIVADGFQASEVEVTPRKLKFNSSSCCQEVKFVTVALRTWFDESNLEFTTLNS